MRAPLLLVAAAVLVALAVCASAAPLLRRPDGLSTIEWRALPASSELALHIYTSGAAAPKSQLFSFDDDATVGALLQSQLVADLAADHAMTAEDCFVSSGALRVAAQYPLLRALQATPARSLHCGKVSWRFVQFVKPVLRPNEARAANALKRSVSGADADYPLSSAELISDDWAGVWGWVDAFLKNHWGPLHPYNDYVGNTEQTGRWHLNTGAVLQPGASFGSESDAPVRIAIAADWAAGTRESDYVQQVMMVGNGTAYEPHWTLHVGDIYYVGDSAAVQSNCLGIAPAGTAQGVKWPHGSIGSFAVEGNHEMYARAIGFLDTFLPTLGVTLPSGGVTGQAAGYVALENAYWRVIMLDTGYNTYSLVPKMDNKNNTQPQAVIDWLINEVNIGNASDTRGLIFFTHHQVESAFEEPFLATPQQIAEIMPPNRTVVWLWGHEHRVSWYNLFSLANATVPLNVYGRCVGNGGFPGSVSAIPQRAKTAGLMVYDDRVYELETGFFNSSVSYNGWVHLTLEKNTASLVYSSLATDPKSGLISNEIQTDLVAETFVVDDDGNVSLESFEVVNPDLTVIH